MTMTACMGGFCASREDCARYHLEGKARDGAVERLCGRNEVPDPRGPRLQPQSWMAARWAARAKARAEQEGGAA